MGRSTYIQAVPIFLSADREIGRYFRDCRAEIDAFTNRHLVVLLQREVRANDADGLAAVIAGNSRFAGLRYDDLPCLWLEDENHDHAVIKLPNSRPAIVGTLRTLAAVVRDSKDASDVARRVDAARKEDAAARSPGQRASTDAMTKILREGMMTNATQRLIAVGFGVLFVAAILTVALFVPQPTSFQYTVFRIVIALATAGFVSMTPGFLEVKIGGFLRAGGALAVFAVVYFYAPAALPSAT